MPRLTNARVLFAALVAALPAAAQQVTLEHSAPKLGANLSIEIEGAAPGARVVILFSPRSRHAAPPTGPLLLERGSTCVLGAGRADERGAWSLEQRIPLESALAETWALYQPLVETLGDAPGWTLGPVTRLRLVGPRLYSTCYGDPQDPTRPALVNVVSLVDHALLGAIPIAAGPVYLSGQQARDGEPVFSADLGLGAVVGGDDRVVVFDNFAFQVRAVVPVTQAAATLIAGADGASVHVLEASPPARVLRVELASGAVTAGAPLPWPVEPIWEASDDDEAWVAEYAGPAGRTALRRVDLVHLAPGGAIDVGPARSRTFRELRGSGSRLFATTWQFDAGLHTGHLAVIETADPVSTASAAFPSTNLLTPTPVSRHGLFLVSMAWASGPSEHGLLGARLDAPLVLRAVPPPLPWIDQNFRSIAASRSGFWALDSCCGWDGGPARLLHFSLADGTWSQFTSNRWDIGGPLAMEVVEGALVNRVVLSLNGVSGTQVKPTLQVLDPATGDVDVLPTGWGPYALHALSVP